MKKPTIIIWSIESEKRFIEGLGTWKGDRREDIDYRKECLKGYIASLKLPSRSFDIAETSALEKFARVQLKGVKQ